MPEHKRFTRPDPALIAELYARIRHLGASRPRKAASLPLLLSTGVQAFDDALPWGGLPRAGVHEVVAADDSVAASGFCAVLLTRLIESSSGAGERKPHLALWCRRGRGLYGPGLASFGLDPARLLLVHGRTDIEVFWVMEEALRSGALVGVLGEIGAAHPTALRRLQLAAESHGTMALLLRRPQGGGERPAPTLTRWRIAAAPGRSAADAVGGNAPRDARPCWQVELLRCRSGFGELRRQATMAGLAAQRPGQWPVTWLVEYDETGGLAVAAELRHRPADPAANARAQD